MRTRQMKVTAGPGLIALAALIVAAVLTLLPTSAAALVNCGATIAGADLDNDGFTDEQECAGITTVGASPRAFPTCAPNPPDRSACMDPNTPDLFVVLVAAANSLLPANPLEFLTKDKAQGGLLGPAAGIHLVANNEVGAGTSANDRKVTATQKAVRVTENLSATGNTLGSGPYGTPNTTGKVVVYTQRILNWVNAKRAENGLAAVTKDDPQVVTYMKHVTAHEVSHVLKGTCCYVANLGGHHYAVDTEVVIGVETHDTVMNQAATHEPDPVLGVRFNIGDAFNAADQGATKFK